MTAARYDITIDQGSDFALELIVKESGVAKSLAADDTQDNEKLWGARAAFRKTFEDTTVYTAAQGFVAAIDLNTTGKIKLSFPAANNAAITAGTYVYDLELYQYDNSDDRADPPEEYSVTRLIGGNLTLKREVTR